MKQSNIKWFTLRELASSSKLRSLFLYANFTEKFLIFVFLIFITKSVFAQGGLDSGLVAFWPFSHNANDSTGNGHNGTVIGANLTLDRFGRDSMAYDFNGSSDYIQVADDTVWAFGTRPFTILIWANFRVVSNYYIIGQSEGGGPRVKWMIMYEYGLLRYHLNSPQTGPIYPVQHSWQPSANHWYQIAVTRQANQFKLYVDSTLLASGLDTHAVRKVNAPFLIGNAEGTNRRFNGQLDDIRIYNRTLSAQEIKSLYRLQMLVGYWPFTGNPADSSGNGNDGILVNGPVLAKDRYGVANRSYEFNGINNYIVGNNAGNNFPVGSSPRTIIVWLKSNYIPGSDRGILHYGTDANAPVNFHLYFSHNGHVGIGNCCGYGGIAGTDFLGDTTWHFVAGVYEGPGTNMLRLYVDGRLSAFGQPNTIPNTGTGSNWKLAKFLGGSQPPFSGRIDDARIYSQALNSAQVRNLYNQTTTAPNLLSPPNGSTGNSLTPLLDWDSLVASTTYRVQISTDSLHNNVIWDSSGIAGSRVNVPSGRLSNITRYFWRVRNTINSETGPWSSSWSFTTGLLGIQTGNQIPSGFFLYQNYPNPFNPTTNIKFNLPLESYVTLKLYDQLGREIAVLKSEHLRAGTHEVEWDASNYPSGIYFYKLISGNYTETKRMVLLK